MMRPQRVHYLRENQQERSPRRLLVFDTETRVIGGDPDNQGLRLWSARLIRRKGIDPGQPRTADYDGHTAVELVQTIEHLARSDASLWIMAHNLNFDLAVTALPVLLTERGWRITEGALTSDSPWCRLARRSKRVTVTDSWSYLPTSVEHLGELVGVRKVALPADDDSEGAWFARCRRDVEITATAIGQLLDWWDEGHFGNWSLTGPATGWSSYRHMRPAPKVVIDSDPEAREFEARAITGGRREVRRIGTLPAGLYADLDLTTAHLTVLATQTLPYRRMVHFDSLPVDDPRLNGRIVDVLAECEIETRSPRYPWRSDAGVFYPVGRFRTVLAGPEIREARARGELRSIGEGWSYAMQPHMAQWAHWIGELLDPDNPRVPEVARLAAKHWSRSVPGKWAGHTSDVLSRDPDPRPGWAVERGFLSEGRRPADFLRIGGERWTIVRDLWGDDAFPAILAWVQSHTRVVLSRLADLVGDRWVSMNTDGLLVDAEGLLDDWEVTPPGRRWTWIARRDALDVLCSRISERLDPFTVRVKAAAGAVTVISAQHTIIDRERKLSGIPRSALALGHGRYRFTAWPRLRVQLARPLPAGYRTERRTVDLGHVAPNGWLLTDGQVLPPILYRDGAGSQRVLPPAPDDRLTLAYAEPERQHLVLRRALREPFPWAPSTGALSRPVRPVSAGVA